MNSAAAPYPDRYPSHHAYDRKRGRHFGTVSVGTIVGHNVKYQDVRKHGPGDNQAHELNELAVFLPPAHSVCLGYAVEDNARALARQANYARGHRVFDKSIIAAFRAEGLRLDRRFFDERALRGETKPRVHRDQVAAIVEGQDGGGDAAGEGEQGRESQVAHRQTSVFFGHRTERDCIPLAEYVGGRRMALT